VHYHYYCYNHNRTAVSDDARLDIHAAGFWDTRHQRAYVFSKSGEMGKAATIVLSV